MILRNKNVIKAGQYILLVFPLMLIIFHLLIIGKLIPSDIVWIGNIDNPYKLYILETISIILNLLLFLVGSISREIIKNGKIQKIVIKVTPVLTWFMIGNTVANIFAESFIERVIFTPVMACMTLSLIILSKNFKDRRVPII